MKKRAKKKIAKVRKPLPEIYNSPHYIGIMPVIYDSLFDPVVKEIVFARYNGICNACKKMYMAHRKLALTHFEKYYHRWTIHYIVPMWQGGINEIDNYQLLCRVCYDKLLKKNAKEHKEHAQKEELTATYTGI